MSRDGPRELALLSKASRALAEVRTIDEIKAIRDKAEAARHYAKSAAMGLEAQNFAAEVKLRAERKAGALLSALHLHGGDRGSEGADGRTTLADLGISHDQSKRWQKEASVPEKEFSDFLSSKNEAGQEITATGLIRLARQLAVNGLAGSDSGNGNHSSGTIQPSVDLHSTATANGPETPAEIIAELTNHRRLLATILEPVCHGNEGMLKEGERKGVNHLLVEIEVLLRRLECLTWEQSRSGEARQPASQRTRRVGRDVGEQDMHKSFP